MNFRIGKALIAAGIVTSLSLPVSTQASDGTITFTGAVTASTCTVSVGGNSTTAGTNTGDGTVSLPTVSLYSLPNNTSKTPGNTGAGTFFSMAVTGCTTATDIGATPAAPTHVEIYFEAGPNVDAITGGLFNTASGGSNVEVNLYNASSASVVGTQIMPGVQGAGSTQPDAITITSATGTGSAHTVTQWFYAGYSTAGANAAATAGAVSTSVTYSLIYD